MNDDSAAQALRRSRREPEEFALFYEEHVESLLAYVMRRVWDVDVALDLTAESFAQAYLNRRRFRGSTEAEAAGWLYGIAKRQLALYFRRSAVEKRALQRLGLEAPRFDAEEEARLRDLVEPDESRRSRWAQRARRTGRVPARVPAARGHQGGRGTAVSWPRRPDGAGAARS